MRVEAMSDGYRCDTASNKKPSRWDREGSQWFAGNYARTTFAA